MVTAALWPWSGSESWEAWAQAEWPPSPPRVWESETGPFHFHSRRLGIRPLPWGLGC